MKVKKISSENEEQTLTLVHEVRSDIASEWEDECNTSSTLSNTNIESNEYNSNVC